MGKKRRHVAFILLILGAIIFLTGLFSLYALLYEDTPAVLRAKVTINDFSHTFFKIRPLNEYSFHDNPSYQEEKKAHDRTTVSPSAKELFFLEIPKIKRRFIVREGTSKKTLSQGPGHIEGTSMPWETKGNTGISGHRVSYGAPFKKLDSLEPGDTIKVSFETSTVTYLIVWKKRVPPSDISILSHTKERTITLITCDPPFSGKYRLVVRGIEVKEKSPD